jgi:hypothetical protein
MSLPHKLYTKERGNYRMRLCLSSIQHKNLTPYKFETNSTQKLGLTQGLES